MTETKDLLIEIGTEELPPKALCKLASAFANGIEEGLIKANLSQQGIKWFATPRRIAVIVSDLEIQQGDIENFKRGPAVTAAFDSDNNPTPAAIGFAKSCGLEVGDLETQKNDKGEWLSYIVKEKGKDTKGLIPDIANQALSRLPIPKRMRWSDSDVEFVRPVHWIVVLFGKEVVPCTILGITASNLTYGHRFHQPDPIKLSEPGKYEEQLLEKGFVVADFGKRKERIEKAVITAAQTCGGVQHMEEELLNEVTSLVEWPVAITGSFDDKYLELPREVLIATMQVHQKYFPVKGPISDKKVYKDEHEQLLPFFIAITNLESKEPEKVKKGNERVIRPRLSDAAFFWKRDCTKPLIDYSAELKDIIYQKELGTLADKADRIKKLAVFISAELNIEHETITRAAILSKCDLLTDMVGEFPALQGTMGKYYALQSDETEEVARAIEEQYMPRQAGAALPQTDSGQILAIADKLDTLVGIFAIGQVPTGEKDPYGLRRAALGCLRIMIECDLDLDLETCLMFAAGTFEKNIKADTVIESVFDFMMERLRRFYLDKGVSPDTFESVLAIKTTRPLDFYHRITAVTEFRKLAEAESLAAANKRIRNILKKSDITNNTEINDSLLSEESEIELAKLLNVYRQRVAPMIENRDYKSALTELAGLRKNVDSFFDNVMVMCDDPDIKNNRLALLNNLSSLFLETADISKLQS